MPTPRELRPERWIAHLQDRRGRNVVVLSHCLLNQNTRFLGGASCPGAVGSVVRPCLDAGAGIVQLPCPEQRIWGGLFKRRLLTFFGAAGTARYRLRPLFLPFFLWMTRRSYRRLARAVAPAIADHMRAGVRVLALVGVDGSPSCGVNRTSDPALALERLGWLPASATSDDVAETIASTVVPGEGMFVAALRGELARLGVRPDWLGHDLFAELRGDGSTANLPGVIRTRSLSV